MEIMVALTVLGPIIYKRRGDNPRWKDACHIQASPDGTQVGFRRVDGLFQNSGSMDPIKPEHILARGTAQKKIAESYLNVLKKWEYEEKQGEGIKLVRPSDREVHDINKKKQ